MTYSRVSHWHTRWGDVSDWWNVYSRLLRRLLVLTPRFSSLSRLSGDEATRACASPDSSTPCWVISDSSTTALQCVYCCCRSICCVCHWKYKGRTTELHKLNHSMLHCWHYKLRVWACIKWYSSIYVMQHSRPTPLRRQVMMSLNKTSW